MKKRITYIISDIDKAVFFENTAVNLRAKGFTISFILINCKQGSLYHYLKQNQFIVHSVECNRIISSSTTIYRVYKLLIQLNPEAVHCHLALGNWIGLWASFFSRVPQRIFTRHAGKPIRVNWKETIIDRIQNLLATKIIAISKGVGDFLKSQKVKENKIFPIHHGFDIKEFEKIPTSEIGRIKTNYNSSDTFPIIGVIARRMEWKGIQYTINAFSELLLSYPAAKLCLFGGGINGDFDAEINNLLSGIPLNNKLVVPYEANVFALYSLFDVYVHVPINKDCEAFGQTYVEALAAGCPSVFTMSGIATEFIEHKQNAIVVPYQDSQAILEAIQLLLENDMLKQQLIAQGKVSVQQFSFDNYIKKLTELYRA